jgi:hypothetical protein
LAPLAPLYAPALFWRRGQATAPAWQHQGISHDALADYADAGRSDAWPHWQAGLHRLSVVQRQSAPQVQAGPQPQVEAVLPWQVQPGPQLQFGPQEQWVFIGFSPWLVGRRNLSGGGMGDLNVTATPGGARTA